MSGSIIFALIKDTQTRLNLFLQRWYKYHDSIKNITFPCKLNNYLIYFKDTLKMETFT